MHFGDALREDLKPRPNVGHGFFYCSARNYFFRAPIEKSSKNFSANLSFSFESPSSVFAIRIVKGIIGTVLPIAAEAPTISLSPSNR